MKTAAKQALVACAVPLLLVATCVVYVGRSARRPARVPRDATRVQVAKGNTWVRCYAQASRTRCQVFSEIGQMITDYSVRSYSGSEGVPTAELEIDPNQTAPGSYVVLKNGQMLLPEADFDMWKRVFDRRTASRSVK